MEFDTSSRRPHYYPADLADGDGGGDDRGRGVISLRMAGKDAFFVGPDKLDWGPDDEEELARRDLERVAVGERTKRPDSGIDLFHKGVQRAFPIIILDSGDPIRSGRHSWLLPPKYSLASYTDSKKVDDYPTSNGASNGTANGGPEAPPTSTGGIHHPGRSRRPSVSANFAANGPPPRPSPLLPRRPHPHSHGGFLSPTSPNGPATAASVQEWVRFVVLCLLWYLSSAVTNNVGKMLLQSFRFPFTLTYVQFGFVAVLAMLSSKVWRGVGRIRNPSWDVFWMTLPLSVFQILGHLFSSLAISRVSVSFAHTIKALSPLFTVAIYRLFYGIGYANSVYASLAPLTAGVMLVMTNKLSFHFVGFICALISTIIFVLQNIVSKKLFIHSSSTSSRASTSSAGAAAASKKLDKLNLLFYSALGAFVMMFPLWFCVDGWGLLTGTHPDYDKRDSTVSMRVAVLFLVNGLTHFAQAVLAFWILSLVSPVTYSIASLVKRIFVICASIVYFGDGVTGLQALGIALTFIGLWMYDRAKSEVAHGEARMVEITERSSDRGGLPLSVRGTVEADGLMAGKADA
ncbi:suppressor of loss of ypt1 [Irineochytrium annulatum]|nr:suppressor of loss of ypt1 [Irineochytrium annulatum]